MTNRTYVVTVTADQSEAIIDAHVEDWLRAWLTDPLRPLVRVTGLGQAGMRVFDPLELREGGE